MDVEFGRGIFLVVHNNVCLFLLILVVCVCNQWKIVKTVSLCAESVFRFLGKPTSQVLACDKNDSG